MKVGHGGGPQGSFGPQQAKGGSGEKAKGGSGQKTPPGLAKKDGGMPPGLAKKYADGFDGNQDGNSQGDQSTRAQRSGGGLLGNLLGGLLGGWGGQNSFLGYSSSTPQQVDQKNADKTPPAAGSPALPTPAQQAITANAKALPGISQIDPAGKDANYTNGAMNCGPTVLAMIGKANGLEPAGMTDAQYINSIGKQAGTSADGTTGNGMIAALNDMGFSTAANKGADLNWINSQLQQGHEVIANGDFYSVPGHTDPNLVSGHYVAVTGVNNGTYTVNDPENGSVLQMSAAQLSAFIQNHPEGGFTLATWPETAAAAPVG